MANISIRGLDDKVLQRLKRQAQREGGSVNGLVVRLLQNETIGPARKTTVQKYDDLDALAGTWSSLEAKRFERDTAPFSEVDPALWK